MKRYSQRSGHTAMAELNVTPLLDLAFVLLIIFIITTPLLENHLAINLPTGSPNQNQAPDPKSIRTVNIDRNGQVYLEQQPIDLPALEQALTTFGRDRPDAAVAIYADKSLRYQRVVSIVDAVQRAKISRISLPEVTP